jgi:4-amino-4-deoxy-L-arabinose transferase-like glycosyltransferase
MQPSLAPIDRYRTLIWLLVWALALFSLGHGVGSTALMEPDEGRNAEVGREMAISGDYVVPHYNALPYLDKPVFFFAATAMAIEALGPSELAARLPALGFTLAAVVLVIGFAWRRYGAETALAAGLMLATAPLVMAFSRIVIFDAVMMFWVSLACVAFHLSLDRPGIRWQLLAWGATGVAVLTKGPVGLLLPLLVGIPAALATGRSLRRLVHPAGIALFLLITLAWFLAVVARHPEFPHYAFVRETLQRVATDRMERTGPLYYFIPLLLAGGFPWALTLFAWPSISGFWRQRLGAHRDEIFLLVWILMPLLFFSLSQSKRSGYILPVFPALALLAARILQCSPAARRGLAWGAGVIAGSLGITLLVAGANLATRIDDSAEIAAAVARFAPFIGGVLLLTALLAVFASRWRVLAVPALALIPIGFLIGLVQIVQPVGEYRSARAMSEAILAASPATVRVVGVGAFPPSLPFYLEQPMQLASTDGDELRSNYVLEYHEKLRELPGSTLRPRDWWREALARCSEPTVFVVYSYDQEERALLASLPLLFETQRYAAYGPC